MNLAILHYHLDTGGVTRVVQNHLLALDAVLPTDSSWDVAVIHGGRYSGWPDGFSDRLNSVRLSMHEITQLDYDDVHPCYEADADGLACEIGRVLDDLGFRPDNTLLHVHNHSLGKNVSLPGALTRLAERGFAMLLELHDFAEDYRPTEYERLDRASFASSRLYPQSPHIHYATLNGRDRCILQTAGVSDARLHLLPNTVLTPECLPSKQTSRRKLTERFDVSPDAQFVLYPVRCIRRKNLGEALLYSLLAPPNTIVGLTLAPVNPREKPIYHGWKQLADTLNLPVRFEVGDSDGLTFDENLSAADRILTTSVAEGFGMVFLECWLSGHGLSGRDLPEITDDFNQLGLRLDSLQSRLPVPLDLVGADRFQRRLEETFERTLLAYGRNASIGWESKIENGQLDFGDLDEPLQQHVLHTVAEDPGARARLLASCPWIETALVPHPDKDQARIAENAQTTERHFSLQPSGRRLLEVYTQAANSERSSTIEPIADADKILFGFLGPERFRLLRT